MRFSPQDLDCLASEALDKAPNPFMAFVHRLQNGEVEAVPQEVVIVPEQTGHVTTVEWL